MDAGQQNAAKAAAVKEDPKFPCQRPGEAEADYAARCKAAIKTVREEGKVLHEALVERFLKPLGLYFEPTLRTKKTILHYNANQVAHTRIIDTRRQNSWEYPEQSQKKFRETKNHDGYKQAFQLYQATRFNMKPCMLVHAHAPSYTVKDPANRNRLIRQRIREGYYEEDRVPGILRWLEENKATGFFNAQSFQHYRFWFFDIDRITPWEDLRKELVDLGLIDYLVMVVETSPGKHHLYFKSELIAGERHVQNWTKANPQHLEDLPRQPGYQAQLLQDDVALHKPEWKIIANRGVIDSSNLQRSKIFLPTDVSYQNYRGDDKSLALYKLLWGKINGILGGDPKVHDEARVAQLPFYRNPKSGFLARVVYTNAQAPHLRLVDAEQALRCGPTNYMLQHTITHNNSPLPSDEPEFDVIAETVKEEVEAELKKQNKISKKASKPLEARTHRIPLPEDIQEYAAHHDIHSKIIWDKDLTGHSNEMLLLLSKFAWWYVDLYDEAELEVYFNKVITPYFSERTCRAWSKSPANFKARFLKLCEKNRTFNIVGDINRPLRVLFDDLTALLKLNIEKNAPGFWDELTPTEIKHYDKIITYIANTLSTHKVSPSYTDGKEHVEYSFFMPMTYLRDQVYQYNKKLVKLEELGLFHRSKIFTRGKKCKTATLRFDGALFDAFVGESTKLTFLQELRDDQDINESHSRLKISRANESYAAMFARTQAGIEERRIAEENKPKEPEAPPKKGLTQEEKEALEAKIKILKTEVPPKQEWVDELAEHKKAYDALVAKEYKANHTYNDYRRYLGVTIGWISASQCKSANSEARDKIREGRAESKDAAFDIILDLEAFRKISRLLQAYDDARQELKQRKIIYSSAQTHFDNRVSKANTIARCKDFIDVSDEMQWGEWRDWVANELLVTQGALFMDSITT